MGIAGRGPEPVRQGGTITAPVGANFGGAANAWAPIFNEIFLGRTPVEEGLERAQKLANDAMSQ
ncbi:hypothetical protein [Arthrobacter sp. H14]|uniref:hypothetical protein n=1 Tax=Arthrobacter sp. H14 TaxID=1312959 RepID=UPI0004791666|nr:hypothetical protein [Arthrobacter sp. H14]